MYLYVPERHNNKNVFKKDLRGCAMIVIDFESKKVTYEDIAHESVTEDAVEQPITTEERIEALESAMLEIAEVLLNG